MPKGKGRNGRATEVSSYHYQPTVVLTAGAATLTATPANLGTRIAAVADTYEWFRILALKFRIFAITTLAFAGYLGQLPDTVPSTGTQIMELLDSVSHLGPQQTCWSNWVHVPRATLAGALPWYKTIQGGATNEEEIPGLFVFAGTSTNSLQIEISFTVEFKGPIAPGNTPMQSDLLRKLRMERERIHAFRERARLLSLISATPADSRSGPP